MAEFCLGCYNKLFEKELTDKDVELLVDLCEGCGEIKPSIVAIKKNPGFPGLIQQSF